MTIKIVIQIHSHIDYSGNIFPLKTQNFIGVCVYIR
jgi:hypothetical protein